MGDRYSDIKGFEKDISEKGFKYVGKRILNRESEMKASGEMVYIDDIRMKGMLHGRILFSPHPHARIKSINVGKAESLPGVHAVIHYFNTPHIAYNGAARFYMDASPLDMPKTEFIFDETVKYVGDRVAAVAADTPEIAAAALKLIEVEYEELPHTVSFKDAIKEGSSQANPNGKDGSNLCGEWLAYGNDSEDAVLEEIKKADFTFEDTFRTPRVHHGYMEPVCHIANFTREGKLTIWSSSQNVFCFRDVIATALELPQNKVRVIKTVSGGAFGGKLEVMHEPVAGFLAMKTYRPVKILLDRKETFVSSRCRHEAIITVSTGMSKDGKIVAQHVKSYLNTGAYAGAGPNTVGAQSGKMFILYNGRKMFYRGASFYTNAPNAGAMRGYGCPQIMAARETHTDQIAVKMGIDPVELRLKNVVRPYEENCMGNNMHNARVADCIETGARLFDWKNRRKKAGELQTGRYRRGVGMDIAVHGNGWYPVYQDLTTITIKMNNDGTAVLLTGTHDLGTGARTILAQIAGEVLELPPEHIEVIEADTDVTPLDLGAQASRTTYVGGNAAILAAKNLRNQLISEGASILKLKSSEVQIKDRLVISINDPKISCSYTDIVASAQAGRNGHQRDLTATETFESINSIDSYVAVFTEVEVDTETGKVRVIEISPTHNSGRIINPLLFEGQVNGGVHMGLGYALSEEMLIDSKTGRITNPNFKKYKMFKAGDMPKINITTIESPEEAGPFGAKSIGECATDGVAGAIVNAVSHALGNVKLDRMPLTEEYLKTVIKTQE
ncbi:MAG: molybdopterin-dependent oxidoreductase [Spirochaetaceae bacterium]|nr:molybdopterin-dependent oxidoreductase [Spirochaetaceae bacterium]